MPSAEPTDDKLDAAFELTDGSSLYEEFVSNLQDVEKDVIKMMEGVVIVVQGKTCMVR